MREACEHLSRVDPALAVIIRRAGPCNLQPQPFESVFEALAHSIVYQQLSGKAAATIYGRFAIAFGDGQRPAPQIVAEAESEALRAVGLSRPKAGYIQGLAQSHLAGRLATVGELETMSDAEIIDSLTVAKGVGVWTAQMLLIFWLVRPDVLPVDDLGIQKGLRVVLGLEQLPDPAQVAEHGQIWAPWRSIASWYLWRAAELPNEPEDPS